MDFFSNDSNIGNSASDTQTDSTQGKPNNYGGLPAASRMCGFLSMTLGMFTITACCLSYLCIPLGALGILFAILSRRLGEKTTPACLAGLRLSITGVIIGIAMMVVTIYTTITNPVFWEQRQEIMEEYEKIYEEMYGIELEY